jgi:uncharacterized MAPEG superfamily protein
MTESPRFLPNAGVAQSAFTGGAICGKLARALWAQGSHDMAIELKIAAFGALLLLIHIFSAVHLKTKQYGRKWNVGARDETLPPLGPMAGRLARAQANFQETFPIAVVALLGVVIAGRNSAWTALGGWIWLGARTIYLPLYAAGVPVVRTLVFAVSLVGLGMVLAPLLFG